MQARTERVWDPPGVLTTTRGEGDDTNQANNNANIADAPLHPVSLLYSYDHVRYER